MDGVASRELVEVGSLDTFVDHRVHGATVHLSVVLDSESTAAVGIATDICALIHGTLKRITLPAEDVVGVLPVASPV